jgi:hypothetical protein
LKCVLKGANIMMGKENDTENMMMESRNPWKGSWGSLPLWPSSRELPSGPREAACNAFYSNPRNTANFPTELIFPVFSLAWNHCTILEIMAEDH